MIITHKHTRKQKEITLNDWETNYIPKGLDSQWWITKIDSIGKLYHFKDNGEKEDLGRYEFSLAKQVMMKAPERFIYESLPDFSESKSIEENTISVLQNHF